MVFVKNSSLFSRDTSFFVQLAPTRILKTIQIWGWCYQSNLLITSLGRRKSHPSTTDPFGHLDSFCSLLSPLVSPERERERGRSAVLCALKLIPKR